MLGGLYGDLPPPSQSSSSSSVPPEAALRSNDELQQQKKPLASTRGAMPMMMPPSALRKASGILAPPPSVLRNQGAAKPKPAPSVKPAPDREVLRPSLLPTPVANQLVAANSCTVEEYDPARPNDYEEYCRERRRRKMEEEVRRDLERRRQEEEEKRNREPERPKEIETHISGEEAWKRRAMLSNRAGESPAPPPSPPLEDHKQKNSQGGGGMSAAQRMMARMGWKEGQGLGKQEQGITTPLVARKTDKRAGVIVNAGEFKKQKPAPSPTPTRVVLLRNMVGPGEVDAELEEEVASECSKYGNVTSVLIYEIIEQDYNPTEAVRIFVQFERAEQASRALADLDGRFFGGRVVKGSYFDEDRFARNELAPLPGEH